MLLFYCWLGYACDSMSHTSATYTDLWWKWFLHKLYFCMTLFCFQEMWLRNIQCQRSIQCQLYPLVLSNQQTLNPLVLSNQQTLNPVVLSNQQTLNPLVLSNQQTLNPLVLSNQQTLNAHYAQAHARSSSSSSTGRPEHPNARHECKVCGRKFVQTGHMKTHMATVHSVGDVKAFECHVCHKVFKHKHVLKRHLTAIHNLSSG